MPEELPHTVDELLRLRAETHASSPILCYPSIGNKYTEYTAADLDRMTTLAATLYAKTLPDDALAPGTVIGILGVGNIEYIVTYFALQRLGLTTLFISPRLSPAGLTHILRATSCRALLSQYRFQQAIDAVRAALPRPFTPVPMLEGAYILTPIVMDALRPITQHHQHHHRAPAHPSWIIHSSGTATGLPTPVPIHAARAIRSLHAQAAPLPPPTLSTLPLFHSFGLSALIAALVHGAPLALLAPDAPVTGRGVLAALRATRARRLVTVPYVLALVVGTGGWEGVLRGLDGGVTVGGAPVPAALGAEVVAAGVRLVNHYGLSECGGRMMRQAGFEGEAWRWLVLMEHAVGHVRFEEEGGMGEEGVCRLVVGPGLPTREWEEERAREDGWFDTKDLFARHPERDGWWRYIGRRDDTVVLVNGEKANAVPFELAAQRVGVVRAAVVFGEQRDSMGMVVIPEVMGLSREEVLESVWKEVKAVNEQVPKYARISRDAIMVKDPGTPFPSTDKGTVIRSAFYKQFEGDIESYYSRMRLPNGNKQNGVDQIGIEPDDTEHELRDKVRRTVQESLHLTEFADDADFFALGMDSLQATRIQAILAKQVSSVIPLNAVFENPSVDLLSKYLTNQGKHKAPSAEEIAKELVEKYSNFDTPQSTKTQRSSENEVVLLTGATGSLGRYILSSLLQRPTVTKIYCLVRAQDVHTAYTRLLRSLSAAHLLDTHIPHLPKLVALPSDLGAPRLGLSAPQHSEIASAVTHVIHSAWAVNFTMPLASFAAACLAPTQRLLSLCASASPAPPAFTFVSSVAAAANAPSPVAEALVPFEHAGATGYARSKWVGERICAAAAASATAGVPVRVLRLGQVAGDSVRGAWKAEEAVPLTVRAVRATGAMPARAEGEGLAWLAVDECASAVVEAAMGVGDRPGCEVLHVCNPRTFSWNREFLPALRRAGLVFESVEGPEWVRRVETGERDPEKNPALKLLGWFRSVYGKEEDGQRHVAPLFETVKGSKAAPSLMKATPMGDEMFGKFLKYWKDNNWL